MQTKEGGSGSLFNEFLDLTRQVGDRQKLSDTWSRLVSFGADLVSTGVLSFDVMRPK